VRGDVYRLKRPRSAQGHEQQGERYAVVVQANAYDHLSTWLVAPTTTKSFGSMIHPTIELLGQDVRVLVEQTTAVDPQRLGDFAGRLDPGELMEINVALRAAIQNSPGCSCCRFVAANALRLSSSTAASKVRFRSTNAGLVSTSGCRGRGNGTCSSALI